MRPCVRACAAAVAAAMASALAGCGWTARDEFASNRGVVLHSQAGDGSRVVSGWDARQVAQKSSRPTRVTGARNDD
jgi:hypothetical protein